MDDKETFDDDELLLQFRMNTTAAVTAVANVLPKSDSINVTFVDHRGVSGRGTTKKKYRQFNHERAQKCIMEDYLGPDPLFGKEFPLMFRLSRGRFQVLMEDVMSNPNLKFFHHKTNLYGQKVASLEAKLMLPLKALAYGVPAHAFCDYFQMSGRQAVRCCLEFDRAIKELYQHEYLRVPTVADIKEIVKLHQVAHNVDGLLGSLDCSHTYWKNCPKAWQGNYQGKEKRPSIVLESMCDYNMWLWHAHYGFPGTFNDLNILQQSMLMERLLDGTFEELEKSVVPYVVGVEQFNELFILVDGIYPNYSRFVKGIKEPPTAELSNYTGWQEACRKDIERAFGVLKATWQFLQRPILMHSIMEINNRVTTCLILHNMLVSDRVMQNNYRTTYVPSHGTTLDNVIVPQPTYIGMIQRLHTDDNTGVLNQNSGEEQGQSPYTNVGVGHLTPSAQRSFLQRFKDLANPIEHYRLHNALVAKFGKQKYNARPLRRCYECKIFVTFCDGLLAFCHGCNVRSGSILIDIIDHAVVFFSSFSFLLSNRSLHTGGNGSRGIINKFVSLALHFGIELWQYL